MAEKSKPCEIYRGMWDVYREIHFSQKNVYKLLDMDLPLWVWTEKTVHGMEISWFSGKEKVLEAAVSREGHVDCVLEYQRILSSLNKVKLYTDNFLCKFHLIYWITLINKVWQKILRLKPKVFKFWYLIK